MFKLVKDSKGGILINIGPPSAWEWWSCGRAAKRAEVEESVATGLPILINGCRSEKELNEVQRRAEEAEKFFPIFTS